LEHEKAGTAEGIPEEEEGAAEAWKGLGRVLEACASDLNTLQGNRTGSRIHAMIYNIDHY
jgi:hypothetical protein